MYGTNTVSCCGCLDCHVPTPLKQATEHTQPAAATGTLGQCHIALQQQSRQVASAGAKLRWGSKYEKGSSYKRQHTAACMTVMQEFQPSSDASQALPTTGSPGPW